MKQIALRYGGLMFLGFLAFFLLMHFFNLSDKYYLRIFNAIIHMSGLWLAIRAWLHEHPDALNEYPSAVALGLLTTLAAVIPFTVFMAIFLAYNPAFMASIKSAAALGNYFTPVMASVIILMEGIAAGLIGSYIIIRVQEAMRRPV
ncbi:MAG: hypothetical protein H6574_07520 [Lewinellaceae bacterium]|nr:hypothetical protein [Lewinellaceae bacterium]